MNNIQSVYIDPIAVQEDVLIIGKDISALKDYLRKHPKELYATPQLLDDESPKAIIVIRSMANHKESLLTMINPQILERIDKIAVEETQAQVEGTYLNIRHPKITVAYLALPGARPTNITLQGKAALMFQQAYGLIQGIPISLLGLRIDNYKEYQEADDEGKQAIIGDYIASLTKLLEDARKEDSEVDAYVKASEFMSEKIQTATDKEIEAEAAIEEKKDDISGN